MGDDGVAATFYVRPLVPSVCLVLYVRLVLPVLYVRLVLSYLTTSYHLYSKCIISRFAPSTLDNFFEIYRDHHSSLAMNKLRLLQLANVHYIAIPRLLAIIFVNGITQKKSLVGVY